MKLVFKNQELKAEYEFDQKYGELSPKEMEKIWQKKGASEERKVFSVLMGYLTSLLDMADEYKKISNSESSLDLTYDTVKHLTVFLGYQYFAYVRSGSFDKKTAISISKKTLAAYLMLLCINEHNCSMEIKKLDKFDKITSNIESIEDLPRTSWTGLTIKVGSKEKIDLLDEVNNAVKLTLKGTLRFRVSRVVEIYKRMCCVDLAANGFKDDEIVVSVD